MGVPHRAGYIESYHVTSLGSCPKFVKGKMKSVVSLMWEGRFSAIGLQNSSKKADSFSV